MAEKAAVVRRKEGTGGQHWHPVGLRSDHAAEAIIGILFAALAFAEIELFGLFEKPSYLPSVVSMAILGAILVMVPRPRKPGAD